MLIAACIVLQDVLEAATEAEADPQTPRTPTTEDLEYDLAGTPRQTSDFQGPHSLTPLPEAGPHSTLAGIALLALKFRQASVPLLVNISSQKTWHVIQVWPGKP